MTEPVDHDAALRERFGIDRFHPWQREAVEALLDGPGRVLVIAPTGGGKSLTYQYPATVLPGTTLVVSPLVALMEDQVRALEARGIAATFLASTLDADVRRARENFLRRGRYKLVYVAPERLANDGFLETVSQIEVPLVAIDEAHCISQWGHDFRPDYLRIRALLDRLAPRRVLACTATATPHVRREIRAHLGFDDTAREVLRGFARPNLHLAASSVEGPTQARQLLERELKRALGSPARPNGGAIVYAATRKQTEMQAAWLSARGWNTAAYHAGLESDVRSAVSARFSARDVDVVVATNAFGMGIDRPDIRAVVHVQPPASIAGYYQEVGRAGRDGNEAYGLLLCSGLDIALRRRFCELGTDGQPAEPEAIARNWGMFRDLLRYLDACTCRHDFVLRYFGDERELLGGCGHCDVCADLDGADAGDDKASDEEVLLVRKALSGVARARQRAGMQAVAEMLRGVTTERTERFGFTGLSTFGLLRGRSQGWTVALLRGLLAAGWIDLTASDHPVPLITTSGWNVMKGEGEVRFRMPTDGARAARRPAKSQGERAQAAGDGPNGYDARLFERLREHRAIVARTRRVPAYVVALDRTLVELATQRPRSLEDLLDVFGMGPARIEAYGPGFLQVLRGEANG